MSTPPDHLDVGAPPDDGIAVRGLYQELMDGWNEGSGEAFAAVFTEDGDLVAFDGAHFKGRREIAPFHQELFDKWMKGTRLVGRVESIKFLTPDVAVVHAAGSTVMRGKKEPSPERDSILTLVAVRQNGEWRLAAFHNNRVRPLDGGVSFIIWAFTDLPWKIFCPSKKEIHG